MFMFLILLGLIAGLLQLYYILAWWGNGCLKATEAFALFGLDIILLFVLVNSPSPAIKLLMVLLLFVPYFVMYWMFSGGSIKDILEEDLEKYRRAMQSDPRNLAAREYVAKTLYQLGDINGAIEEMSTLVQMSPQDDDLKYRLRLWNEEKREKDTGTVVCPHCKTENEGSRSWCRKCENRIYAYQPKSIAGKLGFKGFLVIFASLTVVTASFALLPTGAALLTIVFFGLILGGWRMTTAT